MREILLSARVAGRMHCCADSPSLIMVHGGGFLGMDSAISDLHFKRVLISRGCCREVIDAAYGKIKELRAAHRESTNEWRAQENIWQAQRREDYQRRWALSASKAPGCLLAHGSYHQCCRSEL